jgi:hypothetical protein
LPKVELEGAAGTVLACLSLASESDEKLSGTMPLSL